MIEFFVGFFAGLSVGWLLFLYKLMKKFDSQALSSFTAKVAVKILNLLQNEGAGEDAVKRKV